MENNFILFVIIFSLLLKIISLQDTIFDEDNINCKTILFNQEIIYIVNNETINSIFHYNIINNIKTIIGSYNNITKYKNILKINETNFIIIGLNDEYYFNYIYYKFLYNKIILLKQSFINDLYFKGINLLNAKYISETILYLSTIVNNIYKIIKIDFSKNTYQERNMTTKNDDINEFQCDSIDNNNFVCILNYYYYYQYINYEIDYLYYYTGIYYIKGQFNNLNNDTIGVICEKNCFLGNIIKIQEMNNKYLICYKQFASDLPDSKSINNGILLLADNNEVIEEPFYIIHNFEIS